MPKRSSAPGGALSVKKPNSKLGTGCLILFFGIFAAAGSAAFYFLTFQPLWSVFRAQSWTETPCTIVSSEVEVHDGDDGDTYSIDIKYDYVVDGQPHRGERYHFMPGASSGRNGKQAVVDQYPAGLKTTCYVNPDQPAESIIHRGLTLDFLWGLFSLPFLAVGYGGILFGAGIIKLRKSPAHGLPDDPAPSAFGDPDDDSDDALAAINDDASGPVELKPRYSPLSRFVGITVFALIWNGITSVFVYHAASSHIAGRPDWCLTAFITPFVLVGLLLIWGVFHGFLSLFIPRPTVTLSRARIPLGGTAKFAWRFSGNAHIIRQLKVTLCGEECATYRRGTDTHTDKHTFLKEVLYETTDPLEIPEGEVEIRIPENTMHSFEADNNKIVWEIHLDGEIPLRPDVDAEFPITVTPHEQYQHRNR